MKTLVPLCCLILSVYLPAQNLHEIKTDLFSLLHADLGLIYEVSNANRGFEFGFFVENQTFKRFIRNYDDHLNQSLEKFNGKNLQTRLGWRKYFANQLSETRADYYLGAQSVSRFRMEEPTTEFLDRYFEEFDKMLDLPHIIQWSLDFVAGCKIVSKNNRLTFDAGIASGPEISRFVEGVGPIGFNAEINIRIGFRINRPNV